MSVIDITAKHQRKNLKFIRDIIQLERVNNKTGEVIYDYRVVIKIKNMDNGRSIIHRYTDFLNKWRNSKTKTVLDVADYIVPFLNYITFGLTDKELHSIEDLTFEYGAEYLTLYGEERSRSTVLACDRVLSQFYYFMAKRDLLKKVKKSDFTFLQKTNNDLRLQSPFRGMYTLPSPSSQERLHHIEEELIFTFLYTALRTVPRIALGVYFQMFGGLRIGEVVNIRYCDVSVKEPYGRNGMVISLKKNNQRPDSKRNAITSVKKERNQPIIAIGNLLCSLYKCHIINYKINSTEAVFIDTNGKPMSKDTYRYNFDKFKRTFIEKLKSSDNPKFKLYSAFLHTQRWSTHICRGIFSNLVADVADNATEIAVWRGDSDLNTALTYVSDSRKLEKKLIKNMNRFYTERIEADFRSVMTETYGGSF